MQHAISYHQNCPVCGRNLRIRVTLLGKRVYCQHCGGGFIATEASGGKSDAGPGSGTPGLDMVDALIERAEIVLGRDADGRTDEPSAHVRTIAASRSQ